MALRQDATTTQTTATELSPKLRQALMTKLTAYRALAAAKKEIAGKLEKLTEELGDLRDQAEEMSVTVEGYGTITLIAGTYKSFNKKRYVALGGELALYEQAMEDKPKKAYNKITVAGVDNDAE